MKKENIVKVVTPKQMNQIDSTCIEEFGIPGIVLMENAALCVVNEIISFMDQLQGKSIAILAGKGNNGGDAFAVSRHIFNKGAKVRLFIIAKREEITGDAATNIDIAEKSGVKYEEIISEEQIERIETVLKHADLIVDGMFGTGLKGNVTGVAEKIIKLINTSEVPVIAIDIPSGINGETGKVMGVAVKASKTVTFGLPKIGLIIHPGCEYAGVIKTVDIGIPHKAIDKFDIKLNLIEESFVAKKIPERKPETNKGDYGRIFIIGGSTGMTGAGVLAAAGALRVGAGLVYLGIPSSLAYRYNFSIIEIITIPLEDGRTGYISKDSILTVLERMKTMTVAAIGPGLSTKGDASELLSAVIENTKIPLVIDADGLNVLALNLNVLKKLKVPVIITPHPGEMSRLTGISVKEIQDNRIEVARNFAMKWGIITVLKGARTVVALPGGETYINLSGNPGMATAGTGDVLTGIISGLIGQGLRPEEAAIAGVYLHGVAGDQVAMKKGMYGMNASDIVEELPYVIKAVKEKVL